MFKLILVLSVVTLGNAKKGIFWENFLGYKPRDGHFQYKNNSTNLKHCMDSACSSKHKDCFIAFNRKSKECGTVRFPIQMAIWNPELAFERDEDWNVIFREFIHFLSEHTIKILERKKPRVFWALDNIVKGTNFGTLGSEMDLPNDYLLFDQIGPKNQTNLRFAGSFLSAEVPIPKHPMENPKALAPKIDFHTGAFTIAMWMYAEDARHGMMLFGTKPDYIMRFGYWALWAGEVDRLVFGFDRNPNNFAQSDRTYHKRGWRHAAVTVLYDSKKVNFYVDGNKIKTVKQLPSQGHSAQRPTHILLWGSLNEDRYMRNSDLACVGIFPSALDNKEIRALKDSCP